MIVRKANLQDIDQILELFAEIRGLITERKEVLDAKQLIKARNLCIKEIEDPDTHIMVGDVRGKIIGMLTLFIHPNVKHASHRAVINDFIVTKSERGKGAGTMIFQGMLNYCKKNGIKVVKLTCEKTLPKAHKFYKQMGGVSTEIMFRYDL